MSILRIWKRCKILSLPEEKKSQHVKSQHVKVPFALLSNFYFFLPFFLEEIEEIIEN